MAPFYPGFDHKGYNPRRGAGNTGRVREEDFSIDGRSWDYRDPYNQNAIDRQNTNREKGRFTTNQNAYEIANPLYDYDYGVVRDAAKELGINNVDEKKEVKQILKYIRGGGGSKAKEEEPEAPQEPYKPLDPQPDKDKPKEVQDAVRDYEDSKLELPGNQQPKFSDVIKTDLGGNPTSDPNLDAIKHGDDLNEWYQTKFVPHLEKEAHATAHEIGNSSRYFIDKFVFSPPKLGDPKELFEYYSDKINDDDD